MSLGLTSSRFAAAAISTRFNSCAARSAALPTMNDTRDEYEPLSFGVSALSVAMTRMRAIGSEQHLGDDLREQRRRALADVGGAGEDGDAAVEIELEVDHRVRLAAPVHRLGRARDVVRAGHAEAAPARQLAVPRLPARGLLDPVEAVRAGRRS